MRTNPDMPREVAEYQYAQYRAATDPQERLREEVPSVQDVAQLQRMDPAEVFAVWLEGRTPARVVERLVQAGRIGTATASRMLEQPFPALDYHPIGVVYDGEQVAHVLYHHTSSMDDERDEAIERWIARLPQEEQALARDLANREHPSVTTCRRQPDGTWRLIAGHGFLTLDSMGISIDEESV